MGKKYYLWYKNMFSINFIWPSPDVITSTWFPVFQCISMKYEIIQAVLSNIIKQLRNIIIEHIFKCQSFKICLTIAYSIQDYYMNQSSRAWSAFILKLFFYHIAFLVYLDTESLLFILLKTYKYYRCKYLSIHPQ